MNDDDKPADFTSLGSKPDLVDNTSGDAAERGLTRDPWVGLKSLTQARIALGRAGVSMPTQAQLSFNLDHALARDAVNVPLNIEQISQQFHSTNLPFIRVHSQANERRIYLQRPDLGRRLNTSSVDVLQQHVGEFGGGYDVAIVLVDGLSSTAVQLNGVALSGALRQACFDAGMQPSPIILTEQGRVAIGDEIGVTLNAKSVVLIVGERPGLSSPDSLGIYYTYLPEMGLTDARRNCISNIRSAGMSNEQAVKRLMWLMNESRVLGTSGVSLKDNSALQSVDSDTNNNPGNFLLP